MRDSAPAVHRIDVICAGGEGRRGGAQRRAQILTIASRNASELDGVDAGGALSHSRTPLHNTHTHTHTGGQPRTRFKVSSSVGLHPSCSENRIYFILTQSPNAIKPMARVFIMRTNNQLSSFIVLLFFPLHHTSLFTRCSIKVSGGNIAPPVRNTQKRLERYF